MCRELVSVCWMSKNDTRKEEKRAKARLWRLVAVTGDKYRYLIMIHDELVKSKEQVLPCGRACGGDERERSSFSSRVCP